jgi:predicted hydrocarbon binding protein
MASTVNARIPLSLLEAIRLIDTPQDQSETEYVPELRNKRLGLSDTVYTQIRRYSDALKRGQRIPFAEAEGLGTLIGRRPDAEDLFRKAGNLFARDIYESIASPMRTFIRVMPGFMSRPLAFSQIKQAVEKNFEGSVQRAGHAVSVRIPDSVTVNGSPESGGCVFYQEALRELLALLVGGSEKIEHVKCSQRGDGACEWRAEWHQ